MSDNQNSEQVLEGPGTVVDKPEDWFPEAKSDPAEALDSEQSHASLAEDSNGHAAEPEVPLERGDSDDVVEPANQVTEVCKTSIKMEVLVSFMLRETYCRHRYRRRSIVSEAILGMQGKRICLLTARTS